MVGVVGCSLARFAIACTCTSPYVCILVRCMVFVPCMASTDTCADTTDATCLVGLTKAYL